MARSTARGPGIGGLVVILLFVGAYQPGLASPTRATRASTCFGEEATIVGTDRADELSGTRRRDVIVTGRGGDRVDAGGGADLVCTGDGEDFVHAGEGDDRVSTAREGDTVHGGGGNDRVRTGRGALEALFGGSGNDHLSGGAGTFDGLVGGPGDDVMDGGGGLDTAQFWNSAQGVQVDLRSDSATGHGDDRVIEVEGILGSDFDDVIDGDDGSNRLVGMGGDDVVRAYDSGTLADATGDIVSGGPGDDSLDAGEGADVLDYEDSIAPVVVDLEEGSAQGEGSDSIQGFEAVIGSDFDDELAGDADPDAFAAGEGDDVIDGRGGADEAAFFNAHAPVVVDLEAGTAQGAGSDTLVSIENVLGSAGADSLTGDDGPNTIDGGSGGDEIFGLDGGDTLIGSAGNDSADGGDGSDACDAETESNCEEDPMRANGHLRAAWL